MNPDHPITLSLIRAERLKVEGNPGLCIRETWAGLLRWVAWPIESDHKDCGGFVLADLRDGIRRKSHVLSSSAGGIDYDEGKITASQGHKALANVAHIVYSTWSSTDEAPRWRVIVPFSRPVTGEEHKAIYSVIVAWLAAAGIPIDVATSDPCRLWYIPAKKPGARFEMFVGEGEPLQVDRVLEIAAELEAEREAERVNRPPPPLPASADRHAKYVRGAMTAAASNVCAATPGARHGVLCREAFSLARLGLSESEIFDALEPSALQSMGPNRAREIKRTIADAIRARRAS